MRRTNGSFAHRARPLLVIVTLSVALILAYTPSGAAPVIAITPDPSASVDPSPVPDPTPTATPDPTPDPTAEPTLDPGPDPTPAVVPDPTPPIPPDPTPPIAPDPSHDPEPTTTPGSSAEPSPPATPGPTPGARLSLVTSAPSDGRPRIDPGATLRINVGSTATGDLPASRLAVTIPDGWSVVEAGDGVHDAVARRVIWDLGAMPDGTTVDHRLDVRAPTRSPIDGGLDFGATFGSSLEVSGSTIAGPSATVAVAPPVAVEHVFLGRVDELTLASAYTSEDAAMPDVQRFDTIRVRFQLRNEEDREITIRPRLDVRPSTAGEFAAVPTDDAAAAAFHVGREWVGAGKAAGTTRGPAAEPIPVDDLRSHDTSDPDQVPLQGIHSMESNPMAPLHLPSRSYTEVEFTVRPTTDAQYMADYEFRISDGGTPFLDAATATLRMGARPALLESPVQLRGVAVDPAAGSSPALTYRLVEPGLASSASRGPDGPDAGIHGPYGISADQCAACHGAHAAPAPNSLVTTPPPQSSLCFKCHDSTGTGAATNVAIQYSDPLVPADDPDTGSYYRHDALALDSPHTLASADEFGGVSDRHDACADCHNPHTATGTESTQTTVGWTAPGQLTGVSGVSVDNGGANSAPRYTLLDGANGKVALEYQLCLKCHSGWTVLPAKDPLHPSWWAEDKGVELNPANDSYHPIEAPGKNTSTAMANSLAGTSPYKLWSFSTGSTVRCVNCHGDYRKFDTTTPPAAGSDLAPHASQYRGNLMQNYRDRDLKPFTEPYRSNDFALCYLCHAEAPFSDGSGSNRADTNFRYHGLHLTGIRNRGSLDGDIDTATAGRGDAICAECHFRTHSNAFAGDFRTDTAQTGTKAGLVNFAPNVSQNVGAIEWTRTGTSAGSCTLTCHGHSHEDAPY